ncbi:MAG: hypothetical protein VKL42_03085, partial [Snowella sp.]|nr:hypothetical protein [Snowella sp.]
MCGIAGILQTYPTAIAPCTLQQLGQSLYHRGPDDYGYLTYSPQTEITVSRDPDQLPPGNLGLIHRRLSILDLSTAGWQPMTSQDKRYAITFNGEIYNYLELQQELTNLGYS